MSTRLMVTVWTSGSLLNAAAWAIVVKFDHVRVFGLENGKHDSGVGKILFPYLRIYDSLQGKRLEAFEPRDLFCFERVRTLLVALMLSEFRVILRLDLGFKIKYPLT